MPLKRELHYTPFVYGIFRGDRAYGAYIQQMAPMENQLRDAQMVFTIFICIWTQYQCV